MRLCETEQLVEKVQETYGKNHETEAGNIMKMVTGIRDSIKKLDARITKIE